MGHPLSGSNATIVTNLKTGGTAKGNHCSPSHRGSEERSSGPSVSAGPSSRNGMDTNGRSVPVPVVALGASDIGIIREPLQSPPTKVCIPVSGQSNNSDRRDSGSLAGGSTIRLSPADLIVSTPLRLQREPVYRNILAPPP